ncbi:MAG: phytase, partial [Rivularia sp. (in: cyanobacteria)]
GYLIANSQGDSSYAVFSREGTNEYLGSFVVGDRNGIDRVNESDGLDIINVGLGSEFPNGLLVVQDGANDPQFVVEDEEELENASTNFKFVDWKEVASSFENPLTIDTTSYNPRNAQEIIPQTINFIDTSNKDANGNEIELINLSAFAGRTVKASFEINREADYDNNVYFYKVDNANGEIGSLAPDASGYLQAALNNVINPSQALTTDDEQTTTGMLEITGGDILGIAIVADGTLAQAQNNLDSVEGVYFSYIGANTDSGNFDHIKFEDNIFKFEDLANGGDKDFNDMEIKMEFSA